ncbi:DUF3299 domain-containing protein [Vibrio splendidus]|uniref:DUF3299 domain-containing protein n=1 Tax=Vibrio lentus TaxID=136468 RepID=A0A4U2AHD8_9VIBR|nr:DUF3299 domain-containing protein [Vibrio lentus]PHN85960.1 DUF3299 domain-containing protein [Vibrio splendidus]MCC4856368.1 DUF3299 domain-containing protein [Vibrio lentus]MDN3628591.1 DUF3299 domain-containing protein [Vibrio lentus]OMO28653.1 hypothetical protein BH583_00815 [Vibrio lentus]PMI92223.1 hypothetical protein BCU33_09490 [Vibrio lentus]
MQKTLSLVLSVLSLTTVSLPTYANTAVALEWQDLNSAAQEVTLEMPDLTDQQMRLLQGVIAMSASKEEQVQQQAVEFKETLKEQGINADEVIALRDEYMQTMKASAEAITTEFDGKKVRVPGFIVPLEFSEGMTATEFLLVPVAGACIHMPPPPANQIVRVSFPEGFQVQNVQYPVWVEGDFSSNKVTEEVYLVDGKSNLTMGYEMNASMIEDYYEKEN